MTHWVARVVNLPTSAEGLRGVGLTPGSGRCPGGGHGNPLQCSCLENPMDGGPWRATGHRVTESGCECRGFAGTRDLSRRAFCVL